MAAAAKTLTTLVWVDQQQAAWMEFEGCDALAMRTGQSLPKNRTCRLFWILALTMFMFG